MVGISPGPPPHPQPSRFGESPRSLTPRPVRTGQGRNVLLGPDWRRVEGLKNGGPDADWLGQQTGGERLARKGKAPPDLKIPSRKPEGVGPRLAAAAARFAGAEVTSRQSVPPLRRPLSGSRAPLPRRKDNWGRTEAPAPRTGCPAPPVVAEVGVQNPGRRELAGNLGQGAGGPLCPPPEGCHKPF